MWHASPAGGGPVAWETGRRYRRQTNGEVIKCPEPYSNEQLEQIHGRRASTGSLPLFAKSSATTSTCTSTPIPTRSSTSARAWATAPSTISTTPARATRRIGSSYPRAGQRAVIEILAHGLPEEASAYGLEAAAIDLLGVGRLSERCPRLAERHVRPHERGADRGPLRGHRGRDRAPGYG